jgi:hypothetical protein
MSKDLIKDTYEKYRLVELKMGGDMTQYILTEKQHKSQQTKINT